MNVTIHPAILTAAGQAARGVAGGALTTAWGALDAADGSAQAAHVERLESGAPLGSLTVSWRTAADGVRTKARSTGDKLVTTAGIYTQTDDIGAGAFHRVNAPHGVR